jgi:site-specific DNA-methyltransferase (adenine-specific)
MKQNPLLLLGDCLELMKNIPDGSVDMILCDLPYGTTNCTWDVVIPFESLWECYKRVIKPKQAVVLFGSQPFTTDLINSQREWFRYCWIWDKRIAGNPMLANHQPMKVHEDISIFSKEPHHYYPQMKKGRVRKKGGGKGGIFGATDQKINGDYFPDSIIDCSNSERKPHPTQKPVELCEYLIRTYTNKGETVLDNCMGSGTTGVACIQTGRNFIGMEKDETYFAIAKKRIEFAQLPLFVS